jgi:AcrR family transcriptional regulator
MLTDTSKKTIKQRLTPAQREHQIVEGAIAFFAEVGLEGQTRELAYRLGITQPLLYRYFPSKDLLLERVYEEVYDKRWKPEWEALIADRSLSIGERFRRFEKDYQRTIMTYDWLRIFFSAGLKGTDLPARYLSRVSNLIFTPVLGELRRELGLPAPEVLPLSAQEFELIFGIHGALLYVGIRKFIYNMDVSTDQELVFDTEIDAFLAGVGPVMRRLIAEQQARANMRIGAV